MDKLKDKIMNNKLITIMLIFIVAYPLFWSFSGLDLADTGAYMYWYEHPDSEYSSLLTYFSVLIGSSWLKILPGVGIWWLNFLEVLTVWVTAFFTYRFLSNILGRTTTLIGICFSVLFTSTYIKIFNFHQFNMLLQVILAYLLYLSFTKSDSYFFVGGIVAGIMPFVRFTTVLSLLYILIIILFFLIEKKYKKIIKCSLYFIIGIVIGSFLVLLLYYYLGLGDKIIGEISRVNNLGNSTTGSNMYSFRRLVLFFGLDTFYTLLLAIFVFGILCLVSYYITMIRIKSVNSKLKILITTILLLFTTSIFIYLSLIYGIFPKGWAKLSGFTWMLHGILCLIALIFFIYETFIRRDSKDIDILLISMLGVPSMWLTFAGTGVRLRHVIIGTWILFPLLVFFIKKIMNNKRNILKDLFEESIFLDITKNFALIFTVLIVLSSLQYSLTTNMYDDNRPWKLNSLVNNYKVKNIRTTKVQADAISGVIGYVESIDKKNRKLLVFGNSVLFYSLLDMDSYIHPWSVVPSYTNEEFEEDLLNADKTEEKPIILVGKTNPYYGFTQINYNKELYDEYRNKYDGKEEKLIKFIGKDYYIGYENSFFKVLMPK